MNNSDGCRILYPLSHPQKRIWYIEKLYPNTSLYNIGGPSRIKGEVNFRLLEEAVSQFIQNNDGIRLHLTEEDGEAKQYVSDYHRTKLDFFDFSAGQDPEQEFNLWASAVIRQPFALLNSDLYYIAMFKIDAANTGLLVKFHHIIADGWSINVASEQIYGAYHKLARGVEEPRARTQGQEGKEDDAPIHSYLEYLNSEQTYLNSERFLKNRAFWMDKFALLPEPIFSNSSESMTGRRGAFYLENATSQKVKEFAANHKYSLNTFFVALFMIYLYKVTQHDDIVMGTPVLNRSGRAEKSIFGMFTSTMPFRFKVDPLESAPQMMERINDGLLKFYFHQKYPYDLLAQDIELKKKGYDNLFQVSVNYYNTRLDREVDGFLIENTELYNGNQLYPLHMVIKDWAHSGNISLEFDYKLSDYTEAQIDLMFRCLVHLSEQVMADGAKIITQLSVLPEDEKVKQIFRFNATENPYPREKTIYQLFEEQVEQTPERIAVCFENDQLTYRELNQRANKLARVLRNKGVTRDTIVGLSVTHSLEEVIGILGVIKAGGAYLPIDPEYPGDRIAYMLDDSGCNLLLTNLSHYDDDNNNNSGREVVFLEDEGIYTGDGSDLPLASKAGDMVYIIYTSGSTGKPKGVMIEHSGLVNYIWWARKVYVRDDSDSFALYSSLSFDLTVTSVFTPLIGGNRMVIYRDDGSEYVLYRIMRENKVSVVKLTPSHLSLLKDMDNRCSSVKRFIVGGEDLKVSLAASIHESFGGDIEIYNEYGPTETVVGCMIYRFDYEHDHGVSVPIGVPADNTQIYILDKDLNPLPPGSIGEMYISGDGVARGYLHRRELTGERFIENPYIQGKRMYKTGDLAKFLESGQIEYAGRSDQQVKIRGYRIELGEIERHLMNHDLITNAVVIDRQNANGDKYLCGYISAKDGIVFDGAAILELKNHLAKQLPEYMVPLYFVTLDEIPLTQNGKVDHGKLPFPEEQTSDTVDFVAPRNDKEEKLVGIISQILNRSDIGVKDNFFYLGGDSIKAIQIAGKLNEMGLKTKARDILTHPIIEEMAFFLEYSAEKIDQSPCSGFFKPTPIIAWFLEQRFKNMHHYNQSILLNFKQEISAAELGLILEELVRRHDSLRLNYDRDRGDLYYNNTFLDKTHGYPHEVPYYDLSGYDQVEQDRLIKRFGQILKSSLNIEGEIPIKACIFDLGGRGRRVLITAHHLVIDGVSWRIILEDFAAIFHGMRGGKAAVLSRKTHSMQEWARRLENYTAAHIGGGQIDEDVSWWNRVIGHPFEFPVDFDHGEDVNDSSITLTSFLSEEQTRQLLTKANTAYGTRGDELMITALVLAVCDTVKCKEAVIELEGHGRVELFEDIDLSRTVGWFTSMYPAVLGIGPDNNGAELAEQIKTVKEQLRRLPDKGLGYGLLKYYGGVLHNNHRKNIRFNFLGDLDDIAPDYLLEIAGEDAGNESGGVNHLTALVDINAVILNQSLKVVLTYSKNRFTNETMNIFLSRFMDNINGIINFCSAREDTDYTPSDFEMVKLSQDDLDSLLS